MRWRNHCGRFRERVSAASWLTVCLLVVLILPADGWAAGQRVALVIGNSAYRNVTPLPNPVNDAKAMGEALTRLNFAVSYYEDLDNNAMRAAVQKFERDSVGADISLVYYAGHGMEMDKQNYLIPIDAKLADDKDVKYEAVPLDLILDTLDSNARLKMVLLDACRNNPFLSKMTRSLGAKRSIGRGLAVVERSDGGMVISYSAKEGETAADGDGDHSPYTQALLDTIEKPGIEINMIFRTVRDEVLQKTSREQEPFFYQSLPKDPIYLVPPTDQPAVQTATADNGATTVPQTTAPATDKSGEAMMAYDAIKGSTDTADFEALISRYPDTFAATLAQNQIVRMERDKQSAQADQQRQQEEYQRQQQEEAAARERERQEREAAEAQREAQREAERQAEQQASANASQNGYVSPWVVIVGSYQQWEIEKAQQRRNMFVSDGYAAQIIDSNNFPRLTGNLYVVVINADGRNQAKSLASRIKSTYGDAYAKQAR